MPKQLEQCLCRLSHLPLLVLQLHRHTVRHLSQPDSLLDPVEVHQRHSFRGEIVCEDSEYRRHKYWELILKYGCVKTVPNGELERKASMSQIFPVTWLFNPTTVCGTEQCVP